MSPLIQLSEAAVGDGALAQSEVRPIQREIRIGGRIVECIGDADGLAVAVRTGWKIVCSLKIRRTIGHCWDEGAAHIGPDHRETARITIGNRATILRDARIRIYTADVTAISASPV